MTCQQPRVEIGGIDGGGILNCAVIARRAVSTVWLVIFVVPTKAGTPGVSALDAHRYARGLSMRAVWIDTSRSNERR